jgi:porin
MVTRSARRQTLGTGFLIILCTVSLMLTPTKAFSASAGPSSSSSSAQSGTEEEHPDLLDGTLSGKGDIDEEEVPKQGWIRPTTVLQPWLAYKTELLEKYGLAIAGSWGVLGQNYSSSLVGQDNSVGSKFTLNVGYALLNRGTPDTLWLESVFEDRRPLGTDLAPLQAGLATGSATATAPTWGQFDLGVTQLYLRQNLFNNSFQYAIGKLFAPNFVNPYPLFDDNRQYLSQMFTTSITIPVPLRGTGMVGAWFPTESGVYVKGGMYTVYSNDTGNTFEFFTKPDYFYHLELGWSGSARSGTPIQAFGPMDANNFSVTVWHKDPQQFGPGEANGVAFNANYLVRDDLMVFLRGGVSDGWVINDTINTGFAWRPFQTHEDLFGLGAGVARPASPLLRDQFVYEAFYRFQMTSNLAFTPDIQLIQNPALNPTKNEVWVFSLRSRLTF